MAEEAIHYLEPEKGGNFIDATLGFGGHSERLLELLPEGSWLVGIDQDQTAAEYCRKRLVGYEARLDIVEKSFRCMGGVVNELGMEEVDGILFDLGVSSFQLDNAERGFSFSKPGPLDMRMDLSQGLTAADIVNCYSEEELASIIKNFGEERWAKRIARFIVKERADRPFATTADLVDTMRRAIPSKVRHGNKLHFATRTFQALRIAVNDELEALEEGLEAAFNHLKQGGKMVIITFHSLEDRIVKRSLKRWSQGGLDQQKLRILTRKPVLPSTDETGLNPRSRSAKMRVAVKV